MRKVYIFPALLLFILIILTTLKISGSSIGIYYPYLYGEGSVDSNLIFGKPRPVRSDEWLVNTQLTIAQERNQYEQVNSNFIEDKNLSVVVDVPYRDWSAIFKPHNLGFFVMPLEHAFALKWWVMLFALMIGAYMFSLRLLPGKILLAILLSLSFSLSPFLIWWYSPSTTLLPAYAFFIMIITMNLIDQKRIKIILVKKPLSTPASRAVYLVTLIYLLTCFALTIYPPFQVPVAIAAALFSAGYLLEQRKTLSKKSLAGVILTLVGAVIVSLSIAVAFLLTRPAAIDSIANTVYPGERSVASGGYDVKRLLVSYLQPQLQRDNKGNKYILNQSESSTFIILPLYFILPAILILTVYHRRKRQIAWGFALTLAGIFLFLSYLFVPGIEPVIKLFALHIVPHDRLMIGLGLSTFILIVTAMRLVEKVDMKYRRTTTAGLAVYTLIFGGISLWAGLETSNEYPEFISNQLAIGLLLVTMLLGMFLILFRKYILGLTILTVFTIASTFMVHPLYRGLGPAYNSKISEAIVEISRNDDIWAAAEQIYIENIPQMSGRAAITGTSVYPSNNFWMSNTEQKNDDVYNRYAHILLTSNNDAPLILIGPDLFVASGTCGRKLNDQIDYILTVSKLEDNCRKLVKTVRYPARTFYLYEDIAP